MIKPKKPGLNFKEKAELENLEKDIRLLEEEKNVLEAALGSGSLNQQDLVDMSSRFSALLSEIDSKTERWMELSEKNPV